MRPSALVRPGARHRTLAHRADHDRTAASRWTPRGCRGSVRLQCDSKRVGLGLDEQLPTDRRADVAGSSTSPIGPQPPEPHCPLFRQVRSASTARSRSARRSPRRSVRGAEGRLSRLHGGSIHAEGPRGASVTYGFEQTTTQQKSRQANPGWSSTTRGATGGPTWTRTSYRGAARRSGPGHTHHAHPGLRLRGPRALRTLTPDTTLATPEQRRRWNIFNRHGRLRYVQPAAVLGIGYHHEHYKVDDFAFGANTLTTPLIPRISI
jgi:hypothetical protein